MKAKKKRKPRQPSTGPIFTSPDGGLTVYSNHRGKKTKVYESPKVDYMRQAQETAYLNDVQAQLIREKHPGLKDAWDKYKALWHLTVTDDDFEDWYY